MAVAPVRDSWFLVLRVLHVIGGMPGNGTERQLAGMLRAAHGRRWEALLLVLRGGDDLSRQLADAGVPVRELPPTTDFDPRRAFALRRLVRSGDYDVIHSSLWGTNLVTRLAAIGRRRPAIVVSERSVEDFRSRSGRVLDHALRTLTDRYIGNSADVGAFISRAHAVDPSVVAVIPNGLDRTVFNCEGRTASGSPPWKIGCVGRLIREKGFDLMIAALPEVLRARDVELHIAGRGPLLEELETAAAGLPVHFRGFLSQPADVARFLRELDLFVMPSRWEGLPNAVLEAIACGTPVVATDAPGVAEAAAGQATLVASEDIHGLAGAVIASLADPRPPSDAAINSFDDVAVGHLAVFEAALGQRRGRG